MQKQPGGFFQEASLGFPKYWCTRHCADSAGFCGNVLVCGVRVTSWAQIQVGMCGDPTASSGLAEAVCLLKVCPCVSCEERQLQLQHKDVQERLCSILVDVPGGMEHGCSVASGVHESLGAAGQRSDPAGAGKGCVCPCAAPLRVRTQRRERFPWADK